MVAFSPDGRKLAVASGGDTWVLDLHGSACPRLKGDTGRIVRVAFSPDGRLLATGGGVGTDSAEASNRPDGGGPSGATPRKDSGICRIWDVATGGLGPIALLHAPAPLVDVAFDETGLRLIAKVSDGSVREWRSKSGDFRDASEVSTQVQTPGVAAAEVQPRLYVQIASDGDRLAATAWQALLQEWGVVVPGIEVVGGRSPRTSELRFFRKAEEKEARRISDQLRRAGVQVQTTYVPGYENSNKVKPMQFELWFADDAIGYWFPVVASIYDRDEAFAKARAIRAGTTKTYLVQIYEATDSKGKPIYAVTLGGYMTEQEARARVAYAREQIEPTAYAWERRTWRTSLWSE